MSASAKRRMNAASPPGGTTNTPAPSTTPSVPGFGFATSTAIFATSFDVPAPIETPKPVSSTTAWRMRRAVASSDSPRKTASVPVRSRYASSTLAGSNTGAKRASTAKISRLLRATTSRGTGTTMASGQRRTASAVGMPARTPKARAS
jgi:hypothetical protein